MFYSQVVPLLVSHLTEMVPKIDVERVNGEREYTV